MIPIIQKENERLRVVLAEERESREEELHRKDSEIAAFTAKVTNSCQRRTCHIPITLATKSSMTLSSSMNRENGPPPESERPVLLNVKFKARRMRCL